MDNKRNDKQGNYRKSFSFLNLLPDWLHPNYLTVAHILLTIPMVICITLEWFWAAGIIFALGGICDMIDGALARKRNIKTKIGAFLDPLADKIMNNSAFVAFWFSNLFFQISEILDNIMLGVIICAIGIGASSTITRLFKLTQEPGASISANIFGKTKMHCESWGLGLLFLTAALGKNSLENWLIGLACILLSLSLFFACLSLLGQLKKPLSAS